jgi:hypothetical protein
MILRWIGLVWMLFLSSSAQLMTSDYRQCPKLSPRSTPPKSVRDLRPDDLGVLLLNIKPTMNYNQLTF